MGFSTPSYSLNDLFERIDRGDLQLPDFQRDYLWDVDSIRALILTVLRGYPVGCLMALDTRGTEMRFQPSPIGGAPDHHVDPGMLLLDGQQRLTALYHTMRDDGVVRCLDFRGNEVYRRFYVDMRRAVGHSVVPDEAVFAVNENGEVRSHFAPTELSAECIPVADLLDVGVTDRLFELVDGAAPELRNAVKDFFSEVVRPLSAYKIPVIRISRATASAGVGSIFASANRAGMAMDVMDLLTAIYARQDPDFSLRGDWEKTQNYIAKYPALSQLSPTDFLTAVCLLATMKKGQAAGNREDILKLSIEDYISASNIIRVTLRETGEYLMRNSIMVAEDVPYSAQVVPLAVIIGVLSEDPELLSKRSTWEKLDRWFWSGIFGELYGSADVRNRMAHDVSQVIAWICDANAPLPATVVEAHLDPSRLLTAGPETGFFRGVYALLMTFGAKEWRTGLKFEKPNLSHLLPTFATIFPPEYCEKNEVDPQFANSVLNRTPMSKRVEVMIDAYGPVRYLHRVQSKSLMDDLEFDNALATHYLDPELLHRGEADLFFADRQQRLVSLIHKAMAPTPPRKDMDK
ncbi:DUF262 domain-containing protein [Corynebacterium caspium]|uniref:DUF262 domain-containing protein n=1 Tax=Corynebacterium caspium TaxID=234828 RepID=UPI00036025F4|nr:DUF262 domain-containing protein [Corynebacterium caspium]WKD59411.1 hypothetical protein CCASP_05115 [Corynebacterium caspium DSM 44850]